MYKYNAYAHVHTNNVQSTVQYTYMYMYMYYGHTLIDFLISVVNTPSLHVPVSDKHPNTSDRSKNIFGYTFCSLTVFNSLSPSFELSVEITVFNELVFPDASLPDNTRATQHSAVERREGGDK